MNNIQKQIDFFNANELMITQRYFGKVITISDSLEIKEYDNDIDGFKNGLSQYGYGNFLLKDLRKEISSKANIISPIITSIS